MHYLTFIFKCFCFFVLLFVLEGRQKEYAQVFFFLCEKKMCHIGLTWPVKDQVKVISFAAILVRLYPIRHQPDRVKPEHADPIHSTGLASLCAMNCPGWSLGYIGLVGYGLYDLILLVENFVTPVFKWADQLFFFKKIIIYC